MMSAMRTMVMRSMIVLVLVVGVTGARHAMIVVIVICVVRVSTGVDLVRALRDGVSFHFAHGLSLIFPHIYCQPKRRV